MRATRVPRFVSRSLVAGALVACACEKPSAHRATEVAIAPVAPVGSSARHDERPPAPPTPTVLPLASGPTGEDRARDPRFRPFPRAILEAEAEQLATLLAQTPPSAPDYGFVLLRLGHAYGSVEGAAWQEGDAPGAEQARRTALGIYQRFSRELPTHAGMPEALYFGGLEEERGRDTKQARRSWFKVVSEHPRHALVPACYYGFGVLFRAEAATDPSKLALARQAFEEVLKFPSSPLAVRAKAQLAETKDGATP